MTTQNPPAAPAMIATGRPVTGGGDTEVVGEGDIEVEGEGDIVESEVEGEVVGEGDIEVEVEGEGEGEGEGDIEVEGEVEGDIEGEREDVRSKLNVDNISTGELFEKEGVAVGTREVVWTIEDTDDTLKDGDDDEMTGVVEVVS